VAKQAADEIVAPLAQRIIAAIAKNGDRAETMAAIREAIDAAEQIAPKADGSLVRELVDSKLNNGILATLNDYGTALARADARTARRTGKTPKQQVKAQQDAVEATQKRPRGPNGRFLPREVPTGTSRPAMQARATAAQDTRAMLDDLEPVAANIEASMVADGAYEATDLGHLMATAEISQGLGVVGLWEKLAVAAEGSAFMPNLKRLQVAITSGSFVHSHAYVKEMTQWLRGDAHIGGVLGFGGRKVEGLDARLGQLLNLGRKATDEEVNQQLLVWWQALATHTGVAAARGEQLTDDALRALLEGGAPMDQRVAGAMGADALGPEQVDMAMELYTHINEVFAPVDGPLARSGLNSADLMREMQRFGFGPQGALGDSLLDPAKSLADQAGIWRNYDAETMAHPLDVLSNWHKALSAASVRPSIGASMSQLFDHTAKGWSAERAVAEGWKKMPVRADHAGFVAYVDPESYFPPELFREAAYLNRFFEQMEKGLPEKIRYIVGPYDATVGTLKSSMTIWNVSHHVTNVLGEYAMLVMAGVNPLHSIRSVEIIKAGGRLLDSDPNIIGTYRANFLETAGSAGRPATGSLKDRWGSGNASVLIRGADGTLTKVNLTPEEIWARAINDGSAITARESKDMLPGVGREGVEGTRWNKFVNSPFNVIGQIDRRLGEFSATRDNLTRIAHYLSTLEKGEYRSLDQAFEAAAADVHSYHPTIQTLSATDQIWTRRIVFFHTWVRQAAARVLITAVEKPAYVTLPSKWQYNQAEANGLEPESLGKPIGPDPRIPSYLSNGVLGPTYLGGYSPWGGTGDLAADEEPHLWGYSLSSPQLDTLKTFFGGVTFDGTPKALTSPFETAAGLLNPVLKAFIEVPANSRVGGIGGPVRDSYAQFGDYLLSQTGAPDRISGALGMQPKAGMTPEENAGDTARKQISLLTGLKPTDYTNATAAGVAATERSQRERAALAEAGYTPEQIDLIRKAWKEQRGY
ncbi:MAG: hypothetical protein IT189_02575, partial [Microbacteriaceae bacterium]|nr:hypothetical protein [Microbacteriaceae bacterium]